MAPIKTVSVLRLQLNPTVLLTRLLKFVRDSLDLQHIPMYGWTDSSIALTWLRRHPSKWNIHVTNRVSEVQTCLPSINWNHVPSQDNPADYALRGLSPKYSAISNFGGTDLPGWVSFLPSGQYFNKVSNQHDSNRELVESELRKVVVCHTQSTSKWELPNKVSSWMDEAN